MTNYNIPFNPVKTEEQKEVLRKKANEQWANEESIRKAQEAQERRKSSGWNEKMKGNTNGSGRKGKQYGPQTPESNAKRSATLMGRVVPSITGVPKEIVTCPNCNKSGGRPQMYQWHFDRCKFKKD